MDNNKNAEIQRLQGMLLADAALLHKFNVAWKTKQITRKLSMIDAINQTRDEWLNKKEIA